MRRRLTPILAAAALLALGAAPARGAEAGECENPSFGFCHLEMTFTGPDGKALPFLQAGSHPFAQRTTIDANTTQDPKAGRVPSGQPEELRVELPPGFTGSPDATPQCEAAGFATLISYAGGAATLPDCPDGAAVGLATARGKQGSGPVELATPVYNLVPPPGDVARLGFAVSLIGSVVIDLKLGETPPYDVIATTRDIPQTKIFYGADLELWSDPGAESHNPDRGICGAELEIEFKRHDLGDFLEKFNCPASIPPLAFFTVPRSCTGPLPVSFQALSWQGQSAAQTIFTQEAGGCERLGLAPEISATPTSRAASSGSGLDFNLDIQDEGLTDVEGIAGSDIKKAVVTLPEGVTVNPSQAEGLSTCTVADFEAERSDSPFGAGCPAGSKIGSAEAESPLLKGVVLRGSVFIATPRHNLASDSLIGLYFTLKEPQRGLNIGLVGKVTPDPRTGQLVTTVGEAPHEVPQLPASHFRFHFREGARSPLITPPGCGTYTTEALFTPWANPAAPVSASASFAIDHGPEGRPCPPPGPPPFEPGFKAGSLSNHAGSYSPFYMRLTRRDGDQDLTRLSTKMPLGLTAKLAGVERCTDAQIAAAKSKSGRSELASPSCPLGSLIGTVTGGAGVGSELTYVPGRLYLAAPYNGAPLSVVAIVPAVAGPFDVGTIVTRFALDVDPRSAEVTVDGARSDPIPHILEGIPLSVRDIRADVDRSGFALNPTSCEVMQSAATIWGGGADVFSSADDSPVSRDSRYQAAGCRGLAFKPRLALRLKGGTRRGGHPKLHGLFRPRPGEANAAGLVLRLPHSAFLDQAHIRTICTRVQFAAGAGHGSQCPKGAVYGHVKAYTPLLSEPLSGPAFLRSSNHNLPDLVFTLHSEIGIDFEAVARIDSVHGGIRATFTQIPDAPISRVAVDMQGGKKGLIVNSTNLCARKHRANALLSAHNGARAKLHPLLRPRCGKAGHKGHRGHRRKRSR